jgi:hypothetical protein
MNYHNALSRETIYRRIKKDNEGGDWHLYHPSTKL